jgi:hypothetical protein
MPNGKVYLSEHLPDGALAKRLQNVLPNKEIAGSIHSLV